MLNIGGFRFAIDTAAYQELTRRTAWRWEAVERVSHIAHQAVGRGLDSLSLSGVVYPHWNGGAGQIDALRALAAPMQPLVMADGRGNNLGKWVIKSVEEVGSKFTGRGTPLSQKFIIEMAEAGTDTL